MFSNKTKDSGDIYSPERRTNFVPAETEVNSGQTQKTGRLNMLVLKCPLKTGLWSESDMPW